MIEVDQLTRHYGALTAVQGISFSVAAGEIVGFLGPNGAGKSTTMRMLTGSLGVSDGVAKIGGFDVSEEPQQVQRLVGYLPESPPVYADMTVRSYLRYCARLKKAASPVTAADAAIEKVDLGGVAHRLIGHLSKGFRQRVGIAQALVHEPKVLILDEPSSGLDPSQRIEIRSLVKTLAQGDVTVLLSTHILPEVEAICDRVLILHEGRIVVEDTLQNLSRTAGVLSVHVARPAEDTRAVLAAIDGVDGVETDAPGAFRVHATVDVREEVAAKAVSYGLLELSQARQGLEEVFVRVTSAEGT